MRQLIPFRHAELLLILFWGTSRTVTVWSFASVVIVRKRGGTLMGRSTTTSSAVLPWRKTTAVTTTTTSTSLPAVSSSDLNEKRKRRQKPATSKRKSSSNPNEASPKRVSVVTRLHRAAKRAHAESKGKSKQQQKSSSESSNSSRSSSSTKERLPTLQQLSQAIDRRLNEQKRETDIRDPMIQVVNHNQQVSDHHSRYHRTITTTSSTTSTTKQIMECSHVAIVLSKPLHQDEITVEYANRIRRLVSAMRDEGYRPDAVCFVGPRSAGNRVADADAGYVYFKHLARAHRVDVSNLHIVLEHQSAEGGAFQHLVERIQQECLASWRKQAFDEDEEQDLESFSTKFRKRLPVHFSIVSSEYHLCQLNDIHVRSPGQSPLRALGGWMRASVDTTWSYQYASTIAPSGKGEQHPIRTFLTRQYQTAQRLVPVIHNLRGVVANREFFQRDSYRVLVAARRALVADMEQFYQEQPSLRQVNQYVLEKRKEQPTLGGDAPMDVILEGSLLNLGRCLDVVRPAGLLTGTVSANDWRLSLHCLEEAVSQITQSCDPDCPLEPDEWGVLETQDDDEDEVAPSTSWNDRQDDQQSWDTLQQGDPKSDMEE